MRVKHMQKRLNITTMQAENIKNTHIMKNAISIFFSLFINSIVMGQNIDSLANKYYSQRHGIGLNGAKVQKLELGCDDFQLFKMSPFGITHCCKSDLLLIKDGQVYNTNNIDSFNSFISKCSQLTSINQALLYFILSDKFIDYRLVVTQPDHRLFDSTFFFRFSEIEDMYFFATDTINHQSNVIVKNNKVILTVKENAYSNQRTIIIFRFKKDKLLRVSEMN